MAQIANKQFCFNYLNIRAGTQSFNKSTTSGLSTNAVSVANISGGGFSYIPSGVDPFFYFSTSFSGNTGRYLVITLRKRSGNTVSSDFCQIFYETSAHGFSESYSFHKNFTPESDWTTFVCDMHNLTVGGTDWKNSTITRIRVDIGTTTGSNYDIQSVMVMQPRTWSPTGTTTQVMNMQAVAKLCDWANAQRSLSSNYQSQSGITTQVMDTTAAIRAINKWLLTPIVSGEYGEVTAGTYSWTVPYGITSITVTLVGGGGKGGSSSGGGKGGGSGYQARTTVNVASGDVLSITVGKGGQTTNGKIGEDGEATILYKNGVAILTANGGVGGQDRTYGGSGLCNGGDGGGFIATGGYNGKVGSSSPTVTIYYPVGSGGNGGTFSNIGANQNGYNGTGVGSGGGGICTSPSSNASGGGGGGGAGTKLTVNGVTYNNESKRTSIGNPGGFVITW